MMLDDDLAQPDRRDRPDHRRVRRDRRFPGPAGAGLSPGGGGRLGAVAAAPPGGVRRARPLAAARLVLRGPGPRPGRVVDTGVGGPGAPGATWIGIPGRRPRSGRGRDRAGRDRSGRPHPPAPGPHRLEPGLDGDRARPLFPRARYLVQRSDLGAVSRAGRDAREAFDPVRGPAPEPSGWPSCWRATAPWTPSSACSHPRAHPRLPEPARPLGGAGGAALGRHRRPPARSASPTGAGSDVQPEVASGTTRRLLDQLRPRACGWPGHSPEPSAPDPGRGRPSLDPPELPPFETSTREPAGVRPQLGVFDAVGRR